MMIETDHAVMPGLVPGIHVLRPKLGSKTWMAGTSPAMTHYLRSETL
jgi:hypothetical protein